MHVHVLCRNFELFYIKMKLFTNFKICSENGPTCIVVGILPILPNWIGRKFLIFPDTYLCCDVL